MKNLSGKVSLGILLFLTFSAVYAEQPNQDQLIPIVAGSNQGGFITSTDNGQTMQLHQQIPMPNNMQFEDILWANHQFVAVGGDNAAAIFISPDGVNWTQTSSNQYYKDFHKIIYANNQYIAVGDGGIVTSKDAINWKFLSIPNPSGYKSAFGMSAAYGGGKYVISGGFLNESSRSLLKQLKDVSTAKNFKKFSNNSVWFGTATSNDGVNWTVTHQQVVFSDILWDGKQFVGTTFYGEIETSDDGINWTTQYNDTTQYLKNLLYVDGQYVVFGQSEFGFDFVLTSPDTKTWTTSMLPVGWASPGEIKFKNHQFVLAVTDLNGTGGEILTSPDAIHWTLRYSNSRFGIYAIG